MEKSITSTLNHSMKCIKNVTLDHKTSHKGQFYETEIYTLYIHVQMKFLVMHITNQNVSFYLFTVGNLQNIFLQHDLYLIS